MCRKKLLGIKLDGATGKNFVDPRAYGNYSHEICQTSAGLTKPARDDVKRSWKCQF